MKKLRKSSIKAKLLQHVLNKKNDDGGFTLIELLVVIIIIGILSAIALPSFLSQANKAKQSEAKTYVGSMNRAQQAYYLENGEFADEIGKLGIGIKKTTTEKYETENYEYEIKKKSGIAGVANNGISKKSGLKSYAGAVILSQQNSTSEAAALAILCESESVTEGIAQEPDIENEQPKCPENYTELNKLQNSN